MKRLHPFFCRNALALAASACVAAVAHAAPHEHGNLGLGLRDLVAFTARPVATDQQSRSLRQRLDASFAQSRMVTLDAQERVLVKVTLDARVGLPALVPQIEALGSRVTASDARYRRGILAAFVPVSALTSLSTLPGVRAVMLAPPPFTNVGSTTSQGGPVLKTDQLNAVGITGAGITVGVMSDSYNTSVSPITAANDVASGDLPGTGNPLGNTQPVLVLIDGPAAASDEGRAMAQIVHDVAPGARMCFATAFNTELEFANNIRALADPAGPCKAQVIVDDVVYFAEPFFSDGLVAQAVDQVTAAGVAYFSSAGNRSAAQGYLSDFRPVSRSAALASAPTVNLALIPEAVSDGGFHNFNAGPGAVDVAKTITVNGPNTLVFQWNDPFNADGVTTDYDVYVFNQAGTALVASWNDDNFATDEPIEGGSLVAGTYQLVVVRRGASPNVPTANKIRYVDFGLVVRTEYVDDNTPLTYGHNSARGAIGTAAVPWYAPYATERFTSPGPVVIYFDAQGTRLPEPEVRQKPDISAPDGVNTTFFTADTAEDADTFPNFFGTSASAPHAAAVAALLLQKAGGPGALSPGQIRSVLQSTALPHNLVPGVVDATAAAGLAKVVVTAEGNPDFITQFNPNFFKVSMLAPAGYTLQSLTIDLTTANAERVRLGVAAPGLQFDPRPINTGFPLTLGTLRNLTPANVSFSALSTAAPFSKALTLTFAPGSFVNKSSLTFGVDRDEVAINTSVQKSADLLIGGTVSGSVLPPGGANPIPFSAPFKARQVAPGYSPLDGFGLIDAVAAAAAVPAPAPTKTPR